MLNPFEMLRATIMDVASKVCALVAFTMIALGILLSLSGCVSENNCYRTVLKDFLKPQLVDSHGTAVTDSLAHLAGVYEFANGRFVGELTPQASGLYPLPVNDCDNIVVVALATHFVDDFNMHIPEKGSPDSDIWAELMRTTQKDNNVISGKLWYGSWIYPSGERPTGTVILPMTNHAARLRLVVKHFTSKYESTDCTVRVSGLGQSIGYDGNISGGSMTYNLTAHVNSDGELVSEYINVLPTPEGRKISIAVMQNGQSIINLGTEDELTLSSGEDKTVIYDVSTSTLSMSVGDWTEASSEVTI